MTVVKSLKFITLLVFLYPFYPFSALQKKTVLNNYDFKSEKQYELISKLNEISDVTNSNDGNIFGITDEIGTIYKLNPSNGQTLKRFFLGKWTAEADFEGIANSGRSIFAISSEGVLYEFPEGNNEKAVDYEVVKLPFSSKFDIEGLYFDSELNGLLVVPKDYAGKKFKDYRTIYFYSLQEKRIDREPIIKISLKKLKKDFDIKDFYPSGISKHPITGTYIIVSARGDNVLVEIDGSGEILGVEKLSEKKHRQPEGITFLENGNMIISDEAAGKKPKLTVYKYED
jgi:uncharacterized protein YjiK